MENGRGATFVKPSSLEKLKNLGFNIQTFSRNPLGSIQIHVGKVGMKRGMNINDLESSDFLQSLFHEMQHAVDNIEGHPPGSNPSAILGIVHSITRNPDTFSLVRDRIGKILEETIIREQFKSMEMQRGGIKSTDNTIKYAAFHLERFIRELSGVLDIIYGGDDNPDVYDTYLREMGESTSRITGEIASIAITGNRMYDASTGAVNDTGRVERMGKLDKESDDSLGPYRRYSQVMKFTWMLPRPSHLSKLKKHILKNNPEIS